MPYENDFNKGLIYGLEKAIILTEGTISLVKLENVIPQDNPAVDVCVQFLEILKRDLRKRILDAQALL